MKKYLKLTVFVLLVSLVSISCTDDKAAKEALKDAGYHPISVGGYGWLDCGKGDFYATRFKAYSADSSRKVSGCVCQGLFKGKTIRLD